MIDKEVRETVRSAFDCYDEDGNGCIDAVELRNLVVDLGGVLTERDFDQALCILDRDNNGVIDKDEFTEWWIGQSEDNKAVGEINRTLARLKDLGRQRFRVDMYTACWNGFDDVVSRLVDDGSELVNERDVSEYGNQNSPLHYAAYQGSTSICNILIAFKANINAINGSGCTPVFFATQQGHVEVVKLLLQKGADLRIAEHKNGLTPVDVCTDCTIMALFRDLPGKPPSTPAAPTLEPLSDSAMRISWSPPRPNLDEFVPISGYKIKLASTSAPSKIVHAIAIPTETCLYELCANTEYFACISAVNLHGESDFSSESKIATTKKAKLSAPILSLSDIKSTEFTVMWALADDTSDIRLTIYLTSPESNGTCRWESIFQTDVHSANCTTVRNLFPNHRYKVRAAITSSDGQKTLTDAIAIRTSGKAEAKYDI